MSQEGGQVPAAARLRVETRGSGISPARWMRSVVATLVSATLGHSDSWPPVDVVLVDTSDGRTLRVWQEGGDNAATLLSILNEDLSTMSLGLFLEKWDVPAL